MQAEFCKTHFYLVHPWGAVVGQRYQVQYGNAMSASNNWLNIGGQVSARLNNVVELLPYTNTMPQAFYRVVEVP